MSAALGTRDEDPTSAANALHGLLAASLPDREARRVVEALVPRGPATVAAALALAEADVRAGRLQGSRLTPRLLSLANLTAAQRRCVEHVVPSAASESGRDARQTGCAQLIDTFGRHPSIDGRVCLALVTPGAGAEAAAQRAADLAQAPGASWRELASLRGRLRRLGFAPLLVEAIGGDKTTRWAPLLRAERTLGRGGWATLARLLARARAAATAAGKRPPNIAWLSTCAEVALQLGPRPLARAAAAVCVAHDADSCLLDAKDLALALRGWAPLSRATGLALAPRLGARPTPAQRDAWAATAAPIRALIWATHPHASAEQIALLASLPAAQIAAAMSRLRQAAATIGHDRPDGGLADADAERLRVVAAMDPATWQRGHTRATAYFASRPCACDTFLGAIIALAPLAAPVPTRTDTKLLLDLPEGDACAQLRAWQRLPAGRRTAALQAVYDLLQPWKNVRTFVGCEDDWTDDDDDYETRDLEPPLAAETLLGLVADHVAGGDATSPAADLDSGESGG